MFTGVRFKCVGPRHDLPLFRISRFPILEFRIPNSVWHMGILEYRTRRLRAEGAGAGGRDRGPRGRATGGGGHGMSYANSRGRTLDVRWGTLSSTVKSERGDRHTRKEGTDTRNPHTKGDIGQLGRKSGNRVSTPSGQQKTPQGLTYGARWG